MIFLRPKQEKSNKYSGASKPNAATSFMERPFFIEKKYNMFDSIVYCVIYNSCFSI